MSRSKKVIIIAAVVLIAALLIGAVAWLLTRDGQEPGTEPGTKPSTQSGTQPTTQSGPEHVHSYGQAEVLTAATCVEDGICVSRCACGAELLTVQKAAGHAMGQWTTETEATCLVPGVMSAVCETCGQKETKSIACTKHDYRLQEPAEGETAEKDRYLCTICADQFTVDPINQVNVLAGRHFADCEPTFSFKIYCEQDAAYICEHLTIVDAYYQNSADAKPIAYNLQSGLGAWWTVTPVNAYTPGNLYIASRSGEVFFENFGVQDLTFAIKREESKQMELSQDVIFLQTLEHEDPGYYPYTLEYSEATNTYWLSLNKLGALAVGDTICVGNAQSLEDVIRQDEETDVFGRIKKIEYSQTGGNYLLLLEAPDLTELFSVLDVYSSDMLPPDSVQMSGQAQLTAQATQILYQSEDFAKFICAAHSTTASYLSSRGLGTSLASLKDFLSQIEITDEGTVVPYLTEDGYITGKIVLNGSIEIPVTMTADPESEQVGSITIYFNAFIELNSLKVTLQIQKYGTELEIPDSEIEDAEEIAKMLVGVNQQITTGFTFGVEMNLDWSLTAKPYVLNTKSGTYHFKSCKHVAAVQDPSQLQKLSAEELFTLIAEEKIDTSKECKTCRPIGSMLADHYILNTESKLVHLPSCSHLKAAKKAPLQVSELPFGNILAMGYTECQDCAPSSRYTNSFSEQLLDKMKYEDMGDSLAQFKELADDLANDSGASEMEIATIPFTITGVDVIELKLAVYFDFHLEATMEYQYTLQMNSHYGIYLTQDGFDTYSDTTTVTTENNVSLTGKARVDVGVIAGINLHLKGIEEFCFVELDAKVGLYAQIQGALRHDFLNSFNSYTAAYFEAGVHCDLIGSAKLAVWEERDHSFVPADLRDIPLLRYGYEKVYYNFDQMPEVLQLNTIYYNLEDANLLNVKYFDVIRMEEGTDTLSINGISGKYTVDFKLKSGTNCSISSGFILVNTPEEAFEDELTVTVTGHDQWGKYRKGNTKYNVGSYTVKIVYDPLKNTISLPDDAVQYGDHYYRLFRLEGVTSYAEAKAYCESLGGYPCTVTSEEENTFVAGYLQRNGAPSQIAFGMVYDAEQGVWTWDNGEELLYTDWAGETYVTGTHAALSVDGSGYSWTAADFSYAQQEGILVLCEWGAYENADDQTPEERLDAVNGHYRGWYTAPQGITAGTIGIHRTNALLEDQQMLQLYANWATNCSKDSTGVPSKVYTTADIVSVLEKHTDEYVVMFMFGPLRENPGVEDGLYTMTIAYDEATDTYHLNGSAWIQRDTYIFVDFKNVRLSGENLLGDAYGQYVEFFWTKYGKVGTVSLARFDPMQDS